MKIQKNLLMIIAFACTLNANAMIGEITQPVAKPQIFSITIAANNSTKAFQELIEIFTYRHREFSEDEMFDQGLIRITSVNNYNFYPFDNSSLTIIFFTQSNVNPDYKRMAKCCEEIAEQLKHQVLSVDASTTINCPSGLFSAYLSTTNYHRLTIRES